MAKSYDILVVENLQAQEDQPIWKVRREGN